MFKKIIFLLLLFTISSLSETLKDKIKQDDFLSNGFTGFVEYQNQHYLVAVGISEIANKSSQAKMNAITEAKTLAQSKLVKFIHNVNLQTKEELVTKIVVRQDGKNITRDVKSKYIETIREKGEGILKNIVNIGKWKYNNEYYYALGVKI